MLGVAGISRDSLENARSAFAGGMSRQEPKVTKTDFFFLVLSGGDGSFEKRKKLARLLDLPCNLSSNALINAINLAVSEEEYFSAIEKLKTEV